ncbi:MAG TPA: YlmC/YmxH family sporulation protein [Oscillospiraceae bacterium]|nr:YlmC/YmxH family sporulation protein [Oscillospiraceae bacterium]
MNCSVTDLRAKDVVDVCTGNRIGSVFDVLIDTCNGCVLALLVLEGRGFWSFCSKGDEIKIPWRDIQVIGNEIILVRIRSNEHHRPPHSPCSSVRE